MGNDVDQLTETISIDRLLEQQNLFIDNAATQVRLLFEVSRTGNHKTPNDKKHYV
jgi:hypothetical protein